MTYEVPQPILNSPYAEPRWHRWFEEGRQFPLFFAQREAAETIIFLTEARADFRQGLEIPRGDPSEEKKAQGYVGFTRYACKLATGSAPRR